MFTQYFFQKCKINANIPQITPRETRKKPKIYWRCIIFKGCDDPESNCGRQTQEAFKCGIQRKKSSSETQTVEDIDTKCSTLGEKGKKISSETKTVKEKNKNHSTVEDKHKKISSDTKTKYLFKRNSAKS